MKSLLVIGHTWPEPTSTAAGERMLQLLEFFHAEAYTIIFASAAVKTGFTNIPENLNIQTREIQLNNSSFDEFISRLKPTVVLFDRFMTEEQFGWRVDKFSPESLKILDTEDLHFLREARQIAFKKSQEAHEIYMTSELAKREIAAIYRCDLSLIISEVEIKLLHEEFQISPELLFYLPFLPVLKSSEEIKNLPSFDTRQDFISIGNFLHEPNWDAVLYLKEKIWPLIRTNLPEVTLNIYGAYPSQKVWNLHNEKENFIVRGRAESAHEVLKQSRVLLAPIRFGAGLKGKLLNALQCGTPSVTTTVGAEGMAGKLPWGGLIKDQPEEFAGAAIKLHQNKSKWQEAQKRSFDLLKARFPSEEFKERFKKKIKELHENISLHRKSNFTGAMLKHHLHRSTYFLSRFIEEKNKQEEFRNRK